MEIPKRFIERYQKIIPDFNKFLEIIKTPVPLSFRINTLKTTIREILPQLSFLNLEPIPWYSDGFYVKQPSNLGNLLVHKKGLIYLQESISMLPAIILAPQTTDKVLDLAAAPGSKTTHLAMLMKNQGLIVANDISKKRLKILVLNLIRMGVLNTVVINYPGQVIGRLFPEYFDKVLLDTPCSLEGTIRNSPEILSNWKESTIKRLSYLQKGLIVSAFKSLKPNGVLLYSTCTFAPEENEVVINYLLQKYPKQVVCEPITINNLKSQEGLTQWEGKKFSDEVKNCIRIYPHENNTEGFFLAKLKKVASLKIKTKNFYFSNNTECNLNNISNIKKYLVENYTIPQTIFSNYSLEIKNKRFFLTTKEVQNFSASRIIYRGFPLGKIGKKITVYDDSLIVIKKLKSE
jgi:NOL1/NOP2/sun family putative RNA methylase